MNLVFEALTDFLRSHFPFLFFRKKPYAFAFLVHPRTTADVARKYPFFRFLPRSVIDTFTLFFWPVTLSRIRGLREKDTGKEVAGYVIAIPLTAEQILQKRALAHKRIEQALSLAATKGVRLAGLGALLSSVTGGGLTLLEKHSRVAITTGHAYTAFNVTATFFKIAEVLSLDPEKTHVVIVGAAGSVGGTSAQILAKHGYTHITLLDLPRKRKRLEELEALLRSLAPQAQVTLSSLREDVRSGDVVVAATNASEALITEEILKRGAIVIDDAQPSDVSLGAIRREDVLVLEAGVVHTPGIESRFDFGLKGKEDNFCCLAEVLILASKNHKKHYTINRPTLSMVEDMGEEGRNLSFTVADFQNRVEKISKEKIERLKVIVRENGICR